MLIPCSQSEENKKEFQEITNLLRQKEMLHDQVVQRLLSIAEKTFLERAYELAIERLKLLIEHRITDENRMPDEFRPYCPASLSRTGNLNIINQIDGIPICINHNKLVTGLGVFGPQASGKSRFIQHFCREISIINPNIKITIIDPKAGFSNLKDFSHIDMQESSFDLMPPDGVSLEVFVYELMPILAATTGLIYGLDLLNQAVDIAFQQRRQYMEETGNDPGLSLKDIYNALKHLKINSFRKSGYHDAAITALSLILGMMHLFSCRRGISLDWLFNNNVVLNARNLTDDMQCRFFVTYLLYWLYQQARHLPETYLITHIVIIDDAARAIGTIGSQFDGHSKTSPLGNILAVLRSSGICLIYATQLPAQVDPSVLTLTRNALVIGNINGRENLNVIKSMMSLSDEQIAAITRFKTRETLAFISGHDWSYPFHGWTPEVNIAEVTTVHSIKPVIDIEPWHSLADIPQQRVTVDSSTAGDDKDSPEFQTVQSNPDIDITKAPKINSNVDKLIIGIIHYPFDKAGIHADKMSSIGKYDIAKREAVQNGLLIESKCGQSLYLIPTQKAYDKYGIMNPYKRAISLEHSFYVGLAAQTLKQIPCIYIRTEVPIGNKGATIDLTTADKSGNLTAYEITISTSNLSSNASKLQDSAYQKIIWLCRDADTAKAVRSYFNKCQSLPPELISKFEIEFFSKWITKFNKRKK